MGTQTKNLTLFVVVLNVLIHIREIVRSIGLDLKKKTKTKNKATKSELRHKNLRHKHLTIMYNIQ